MKLNKGSLLLKHILALYVVILFSSCQKELESFSENKNGAKPFTASGLFGFGNTPCDGSIQYTAACNSWKDTSGTLHQTAYYLGDATFYDNPLTQGLNVGNVSWGSITLPPDSIKLGRWTYEFNKSQVNDTVNAGQFGSNVIFEVGGGSGYAPSNLTMYVPEEIYLTPEPWSFSTPIIRSTNLPKTIYWNQDVNNQEDVVIMVEYNGFRSNLNNPTYPIASFFNDPVYVTDNGQHDITASMLASIHYGAIITIHVGRANQEEITDANGKVIVVSAMTYTSQDYVYEQ